MIAITILAILGLVVSAYAVYLEKKVKADPNYKPLCDIFDKISCSKPIVSLYGKIFGVSNALLGILYYMTILILSLLGQKQLLLYLALAGVAVSFFLAYILCTKIKTFCLVCVTTYIINGLLLFLTYLNK